MSSPSLKQRIVSEMAVMIKVVTRILCQHDPDTTVFRDVINSKKQRFSRNDLAASMAMAMMTLGSFSDQMPARQVTLCSHFLSSAFLMLNTTADDAEIVSLAKTVVYILSRHDAHPSLHRHTLEDLLTKQHLSRDELNNIIMLAVTAQVLYKDQMCEGETAICTRFLDKMLSAIPSSFQ